MRNTFNFSYFQNATSGIKRAGLERDLQTLSRPHAEIENALFTMKIVVSMHFMIDINQ